jgi:Transcription factor BRX N-terminal domain
MLNLLIEFDYDQVESLTCKSQLLEVELERTTKQLKEAISIAGEETAKCKAAKEVIKSLTGQVISSAYITMDWLSLIWQ